MKKFLTNFLFLAAFFSLHPIFSNGQSLSSISKKKNVLIADSLIITGEEHKKNLNDKLAISDFLNALRIYAAEKQYNGQAATLVQLAEFQ